MSTNKVINEYDEIKGFLNKVRKIQEASIIDKNERLLKEQVVNNVDSEEIPDETPDTPEEKRDIAVINDVDVEIRSMDPEDFDLQDEEKKRISQLIDDFRTEVSELVEFDKLQIYEDRASLNGKIGNIDLGFTLSTGEDTGLYISNTQMLLVDDNSLDIIQKLKTFLPKFINTINDLLVNRSST